MATFLSGAYWGTWSGYAMYANLSGDVSRSGNTVTLSNLSLYLTYEYSAWGQDSADIQIRNGNTALSSTGVTFYADGGSSNTVSLNNASLNVAAGDTSHTFNLSWGGESGIDFTVSFPSGATAPTISAVSVTGRTWKSITVSSTVSSWGSGGSAANSYRTVKLLQTAYVVGANAYGVKVTGTSTSAVSTTVGRDNHNDDVGTLFTIKGAAKYYYGVFATNGAAEARWASSDTVSFPPAPLASITQSQVIDNTSSNKVTHTIKIKGSDSNSNSNNVVSTQWRYSTNGGSSWSSWGTISGSATAWTEKSATFTSGLGDSIKVQTRQVYDSQTSETKEISYTAVTATAPTVNTPTVSSRTWNSVTIAGTVTSWGSPSAVSGRAQALGVTSSSSSLSADRREISHSNSTAGTAWSGTVNNSSTAPGGTGMTLRGCKSFYVYNYANNVASSASKVNTTLVYLPPSPLQSVALSNQTTVSDTQTKVTVTITGGTSTNNENVNVTTQYRYKVGSGNWSEWTNISGNATPWTAKTVDITGTAGATLYVEARQVYQSQYSEAKSASVVLNEKPIIANLEVTNRTATSLEVTATYSTWGSPSSATNTTTFTVFDLEFETDYVTTTVTGNTTSITGTLTGLPSNQIYEISAFGRNGAWDSSDVTTRSATAPEAPNGRVVSQTIDSGTGTVTANLDYTQVGYWEPDPEDPFERVSNLTPEYRYSVDNGITWTTWATLPMNAASGSFSIAGLPAGRSVIVQMRTLQSWSDNYGDRGTGYSTVVSIAFDTEGYPEDTLSIAWSYDELRRNFITYSISDDFWHGARTFELTVKRDGAVLSQGSVNVPAGSNSGQLVFPLSESAIGGWTPGGLVQNGPYIPNESLDYEVKTIMNNEVVATLTGSFVTTRPIIGVVINDAGSKYYITDAVKAGGVASADDFKFDSRYDRFIIKN